MATETFHDLMGWGEKNWNLDFPEQILYRVTGGSEGNERKNQTEAIYG